MSPRRILVLLRKDLRLGPRSPVFLWVLVLPLLITLVLQVAFGDLFDPKPRLGIVDLGGSRITLAARQMPGVVVMVLDDAAAMKQAVEAADLDGGLVLGADLDAALRSGARPPLEFYVGGRTPASTRAVLAASVLGLVREIEGLTPAADVETVILGEAGLPITVRLVPLIATYALLIAGVFLPAFGLADEREKRTLEALVVSPMRLGEVVAARGVLGFILAMGMSIVTLWINGALAAQPGALIVVLAVAGLVLVELGLVYGTVAKNVAGVFALIKGTGFLLLAPAVFYLFPNWPQWIAKLFPTFWVIDPVYRVAVGGAGLQAVWADLLVALGVAALLGLLVGATTRRLRSRLAAV